MVFGIEKAKKDRGLEMIDPYTSGFVSFDKWFRTLKNIAKDSYGFEVNDNASDA